jgi:hypothetical protein
MKTLKMPDFYNINFSIHLSLVYSIEQRLWDSINHCANINLFRVDAGMRIAFKYESVSQQGFYSSPSMSWLYVLITYYQDETAFLSMNSSLLDEEKERTFVRFDGEFDSTNPEAEKNIIAAHLLLRKISEIPITGTAWPGIGWLDPRGYWCFRPTDEALALWLQFLWARVLVFPLLLPSVDPSLVYVAQRCGQLLNLARIEVNPWAGGCLVVHSAPEKALIWGLVAVYDALVGERIHLVRAAAKSLIERFLEFDRHCRLLDLDPNSAELSARAGLIVLVQRAAVELLIRLEMS